MKEFRLTNEVEVTLPNGKEAKIESIDITGNGVVKVRTFIPNENVWVTYRMEDGLSKIANGCNFKLKIKPEEYK